MFNNYLKIAIRSLFKDKFFSFLNISGLAIGIACCLLIMTYVSYELSYDKHFNNSENIYRVVIEGSFNGRDFKGAENPSPAGGTFKEQIPQIEERLRFRRSGEWIVNYEDKVFTEDRVVFADETFFDIFQIDLVKGNPKEALLRKNQVVISQSLAEKYFGTDDPLQKTLKLDNNDDYMVTGVFEEIPGNTHFHFDMILSFITREEEYNSPAWLNQNYETYLTLNPNTNVEEVESAMNQIAIENMGAELRQFLDMDYDQFKAAGNSFEYFLQPLTDIHLYSNGYGGFEPEGDITYVYIFSAIAAFILIIACINFMNLSTARSANRAKEVGLRKVMGSLKGQLIGQFISESVVITLVSGLLGLAVATVLMPYFNQLADRQMAIDFVNALPLVLIGSALVGFLAGVYPAFFLSAFSPVQVLKGNLSMGMRSGALRKVLVSFQFFISILLIIGTFSIINQMQYIQNKKLGFEKDQILLVHNMYLLDDNREAFDNQLKAIPQVMQTSASWFLPTSSSRSSTVFFPDAIIDQERGVVSQNWIVDVNYAEVYGLKIKEGRFFQKEYQSDSTVMVINETAAKLFGITDLETATIGTFEGGEGDGLLPFQVIGIVEDFHFESLREEIGPVIMRLGTDGGFLGLKLNAGAYETVIDQARMYWDEMAPGQPFEYTFLDDRFINMYQAESRLGDIFSVFAILAIIIACLGLFGLAAFTAQQKTKEVGIRKVLGASMTQLVYIMSKEVSVLVLISFAVASAAGWYGVNWYFQDFAYRPSINISVFLLAGISAFLIALLTMSYQSIKVAIANPVEALRSE